MTPRSGATLGRIADDLWPVPGKRDHPLLGPANLLRPEPTQPMMSTHAFASDGSMWFRVVMMVS